MKKRLILLLVLFQVMFAQSWLDKPAASTVNNADKLMLGQGGITKTATGELIKAFIGGSTITKVNDYYYFQDAANPVLNDWRFFTDGVYLKSQRYDGAVWATQVEDGGSTTVSDFIEIVRDVNATVFVNDNGLIKTLAKTATYDDGVTLADIYDDTFIQTKDKLVEVSVAGPQVWNILQSDSTQLSTGTQFSLPVTSGPEDGKITFAGKIKADGAIPAGLKVQGKVIRVSDSKVIWRNVTDEEFASGIGSDVDIATGVIVTRPTIPVIGNENFIYIVNTTEEVTLKGANNTGDNIYFETLDTPITFQDITDESNVVTQIEAKTGEERLDYNALKNKPTDHASFYLPSPETVAINNDGVTWTKIPNMLIKQNTNFTASGGTLTKTVKDAKLLFNGSSNVMTSKSATIYYGLSINGAEPEYVTEHSFGAAGKTETLSITDIIDVSINDTLEIWAKGDGLAVNVDLTANSTVTTFLEVP